MHSKINSLAIPAIVSGIAEPVLSITDTAIVGNIPENGTASLAAVGIVGSLFSAIVWIFSQTRPVLSAIISKLHGANTLEELKGLPLQALTLNLILGIGIICMLYPVAEFIFIALHASGKVLEYCTSYFKIRIIGLPCSLAIFVIFGVFRGFQNTLWPMVIAGIGVATNIILDYILVYGIEGYLQPMQLAGAAWASVFSQGLMVLLSIVLLYQKAAVALHWDYKRHPLLKTFMIQSAHLAVRAVAVHTTIILAARAATSIGIHAIAAHSIGIQIWLFFAFFIDGYGTAGNILAANLLGKNDYNKLVSMSKIISTYGLVLSVILAGGLFLFSSQVADLFSKESEVKSLLVDQILRVQLPLFPVYALVFLFDEIYKGLGETRFLRNALLLATFLVFIPALFLSQQMTAGLVGIWISLSVWMICRGVLLGIKFYALQSQK